MADEPRPPTAYKLTVGRSAILKMADRPTVNLYVGPPVHAFSSTIYQIVYV